MTYQTPIVSVIIPVYNRRDTLKNAIISIKKQLFTNFEALIVDDGSTDGTSDILTDFQDDRFKLIRQKNNGVSAARNTGIRFSLGKYIAFLDSDDEWLPEKLQKQMNFLTTNTSARICQTEEIWMRRGIRVNPPLKYRKSPFFKDSVSYCIIGASTVLAEKSLLVEKGLFDEKLPVCEDYDLWIKILLDMNIPLISQPLVIKHGGRTDQLSVKYRAMDRFRVRSLVNILSQENLPCGKQQHIRNELLKKLGYLIEGARRSGRDCAEYEKMFFEYAGYSK